MNDYHDPADILSIIGTKKHFIILGHSDPDGDCICSQLVTASFLGRLGKTGICHAVKPFTRHEIIPFAESFSLSRPEVSDRDRTAVLAVDCSTIDRIAGYRESLEGVPLLMIDHHASGHPFGDARFIDSSALSTTVLIYRLMKAAGIEPTAEEAELMLFGFCTDTGYFRHIDETGGPQLEEAAALIRLGASPKRVYDMIYGGRSLATRNLLGTLLSRAESCLEGRMLFTYITIEDLDRYGEEAKDSNTLYGLLQGVSGVIAVILVREERDGIRTVGVRTNHTVDAGRLAARFGGGGHPRAAGFSSSLTISGLKGEILDALKEELASGS